MAVFPGQDPGDGIERHRAERRQGGQAVVLEDLPRRAVEKQIGEEKQGELDGLDGKQRNTEQLFAAITSQDISGGFLSPYPQAKYCEWSSNSAVSSLEPGNGTARARKTAPI